VTQSRIRRLADRDGNLAKQQVTGTFSFHFFCLPKRNETKKKAATDLFREIHFFSCTRITTLPLQQLIIIVSVGIRQ